MFIIIIINTKTFIFVFDTASDQDRGLEDCIYVHHCDWPCRFRPSNKITEVSKTASVSTAVTDHVVFVLQTRSPRSRRLHLCPPLWLTMSFSSFKQDHRGLEDYICVHRCDWPCRFCPSNKITKVSKTTSVSTAVTDHVVFVLQTRSSRSRRLHLCPPLWLIMSFSSFRQDHDFSTD